MLHPRCMRHLSDKPTPMQASGVDDEGRKGKEVYWSRPWSHLRLSHLAVVCPPRRLRSQALAACGARRRPLAG